MLFSSPPIQMGAMKKFLQVIGVVSVVLALMLLVPRVYERLLPVDSSAALALSASEPENVGKSVVECVVKNNGRLLGINVTWLKDDTVHILPNSTPRFIVLAGRLNWHKTWMVLLDLETEPVAAFETFDGTLRHSSSGFARRKVPFLIMRALKSCGVTWVGSPSKQVVDDFLSAFFPVD